MNWRPSRKQIGWGVTVFLTGVALMAAYVLLFRRASIAQWILKLLRMLRTVIVGIIMAYIMSPVLNAIEEHIFKPYYGKRGIDLSAEGNLKKRKSVRGLSVAITILVVLLALYALIMIVVPQLFKSITEISNSLPVYMNNISSVINTAFEDNASLRLIMDSFLDSSVDSITMLLRDYLMPSISTVVNFITRSVTQVADVMLNLLVGIIVAVYLLNSKELFIGQMKKLIYAILSPEAANEVISACRFINKTFTGFIMGKLIDSLIIGILCFIGCSIMRIPYSVLISVVVGITNIIPFFGPYIGEVFGTLLLVVIDPIKALVFLVFVIILQQFDGNILGPMILGNSTGLSSFWVIFAIMLFGGFWGVAGWILGVPIFACIYAFVAYITRILLRHKKLPEDSGDYVNAAYVENGRLLQMSDVNTEENRYNVRKPSSIWRRGKRMVNDGKRRIQDVKGGNHNE